MSRRIIRSGSSAPYIIALVVIIVAFLLLGGGPWIKEIMHGNLSIDMANWKWGQILISLVIGIAIGAASARRRW